VFAVDCLSDDESYIHDLLSKESSDEDADDRTAFVVNDEDWFSEIDKNDLPNWDTASAAPNSGSDTDSFIEVAAEVSSEQIDGPVVELYDSRSTCHISLYREKFETLSTIPPKPFTAANKQRFSATGIGEMVIEIPNGVDMSKLRLTEVLFLLEVGYTLVSIGRLDELGYTVIFTDGRCIINDPMENVIGQISRTERGLYRVIHKANIDSADSVEETITVMELHKCMGHIAPTVA
jgi:hypothetical protein